MTKRKRKATISFHSDFQLPTDRDREEAIGSFPSTKPRPVALWEKLPPDALDDLNVPYLYRPTSETNRPTPHPKDDLDWLAQVPEKGQTFDDYITFQTSRSGKMRPIANANGTTICLLPILSHEDHGQWPKEGPRLESLVGVTAVFFSRPVRLLPPAVIVTENNSGKWTFCINFCNDQGACILRRKIIGRHDIKTNRSQFQVASILNELASYRHYFYKEENFCIMGITIEDIYDRPSDLFCAGFAFGGSKVAAFSFHRYHPAIRMSPLHWWNYGYQKTASNYSYFEEGHKPHGLASSPCDLSKRARSEYLRRSSKLLLHELGHLYGLGHCIYHRCLMQGTGHLVEDFNAPFHLCGICLRKLQWRLGFAICERYSKLAKVLKETMGLTSEAAWVERQVHFINKKRLEESEKLSADRE